MISAFIIFIYGNICHRYNMKNCHSKYCCHDRKKRVPIRISFEILTKQSLLVLSTQPKSLYISRVVRCLQQSNPQFIMSQKKKKKKNEIKIKKIWFFFYKRDIMQLSSADATIFKKWKSNKKNTLETSKKHLASDWYFFQYVLPTGQNQPKSQFVFRKKNSSQHDLCIMTLYSTIEMHFFPSNYCQFRRELETYLVCLSPFCYIGKGLGKKVWNLD